MFRILLLLVLAVTAAKLTAQTSGGRSIPVAPGASPSPAPAAIALFRADLPGGSYQVAVRQIISVSQHEYVVDAAARVTEVNIDTAGTLLARFYFLEPNTPTAPGGLGSAALQKAQELLSQAADQTGQDAWKKVVKSYPTTTHARTVEYRVGSKEDLTRIFAAAEEAFRMQVAKSVRIE